MAEPVRPSAERRPRSLVIPPDAEAVQRALTPPPRQHRYGPLLGVAAIALGLAWLGLPSGSDPAQIAPQPAPGTELLWGSEYRIEAPLAPDAPGRRPQRLTAWMKFTFRPAGDDVDRARASIDAHLATALTAVRTWFGGRRPAEVWAYDGRLETAVAGVLTRELFPDGAGEVARVSWRSLEIRPAD